MIEKTGEECYNIQRKNDVLTNIFMKKIFGGKRS